MKPKIFLDFFNMEKIFHFLNKMFSSYCVYHTNMKKNLKYTIHIVFFSNSQ